MQEGQHQLGGVAVSLSLRAVPPLLRVVGGYDVRQRKAEHLRGNLCVGGVRDVLVTSLHLGQQWFCYSLSAPSAASPNYPRCIFHLLAKVS